MIVLTLVTLATLGSGLMAGLFCSFSSFLMQALSTLPASQGIAAMQTINRVIVRPSFLSVFLGTAVLSWLAVASAWNAQDPSTLRFLVAGAITYTTGSVLVTIFFNVPLNNRLDAVEPESLAAKQFWELYQTRWTRWNHVRSLTTVASTLLLLSSHIG